MLLDLQAKTEVNFKYLSELALEKGVFSYEGVGDTVTTYTIKILEGQDLNIITNNLFRKLGLTHLKIILEKDSKLVITERSNLEIEENLEIEQLSNSVFVYQKLYESSGSSCLNVVQKGDNCATEIQNIVLGKNITLAVDQKVTQNRNEQKLEHKTKFILSNNSDLRITHSGKSTTISTDCEIDQKIKGIILDSDSKVEMQPILEIDSDSSTSNHGASVGEFDRIEIQYLRTRGLDSTQTQKILVDSFLNDYYDKVELLCVRERWRG
jgi:SUF system FeS cluster assembly, SufBD